MDIIKENLPSIISLFVVMSICRIVFKGIKFIISLAVLVGIVLTLMKLGILDGQSNLIKGKAVSTDITTITMIYKA